MKMLEVNKKNKLFIFIFLDIGNRLEYLNYYYEIAAVNILIVSYRGYSDSEGGPSEEGLQKDSIVI